MELYLDSFYSKKDIDSKIKRIFKSYISDSNNFDKCFENEFDFSSRFIFGEATSDSAMLLLLKTYYHNDYLIRHAFVNKMLIHLQAITFFEYPIENSRIDIASINGHSIAYEIKTKYDTYKRLKKQLSDYSTCFEYVYAICPINQKDQILKILPDYCGLYVYYDNRSNFTFNKVKNGDFSPNLSSMAMLRNMNLTDMRLAFNDDNKERICQNFTSDQINNLFKKTLKIHFSEKNNILKDKCNELGCIL